MSDATWQPIVTDPKIRETIIAALREIREGVLAWSPIGFTNHLDRAGRKCGARSAYSKPGGRAPLCFPSDVSDEMVVRYRRETS